MTARRRGALVRLACAALLLACGARAGAQAVPAKIELAPAVRHALQSAALTDAERAALRLRHGIADDGDLTTPQQRALAAQDAWLPEAPALQDPAAPAAMRALALVRSGRGAEALAALGDAAGDDARAALVRAMALESTGKLKDAAAAARRARELGEAAGAAREAQMDAIEATALLARVEGAPARDWQAMLDRLGALRDADLLDPRPRLLEGRLLFDKGRLEETVRALQEALGRDLRCAEAIALLGRVALMTFDFDGARLAARHLRAIAPDHPLAALVEGEAALQARQPDEAVAALDALLARMPQQREALALRAAADALRFDDAGVARRLAQLDQLMPGSPMGPFEVGRFQALARQYEPAAAQLEEAARRAPGWSDPPAELGLLEMQSGRDDRALTALRRAVELDPFNARARFSLTLVEMLSQWKRFEGERFVVRCPPGADEALAREMPAQLDAMAREICAWFDHSPAERTVIELHPDHKSFGVRITGMPWIHTIAASTGPLIALEAPREGAPSKHLGQFDWLEVLRHEYVHTVTLDQTRNRIPHWFTEALATRLETKPRSYETAQMLAHALDQGQLFDLEAINWAFVRPKKATDRAQAYAQGAWMVEYIESRWSRAKILELLAAYRDGVPERDAFQRILGVTREKFMEGFEEFALAQVRTWGLAPEPTISQLAQEARESGAAAEGAVQIDDTALASLLTAHPTHPDLLELWLRRALKDGAEPDAAAIAKLEAYALARPVDPWPHRILAKHFLAAGDGPGAAPHLAFLEARADNDPSYALELARIERARKNLPQAITHAARAVRIAPYDPGTREFAATLAVEAGDLPAARVQVEALALLEPTVARHRQRLDRIDELLRARQGSVPGVRGPGG
ncbi:MAG: hypothetical protein U0625_01825 [Phycisphaerales bacterium]